MRLRFTKMHGAGNDFVMIDGVRQTIQFDAAQWRAIADRRFGVGADSILLVEPSTTEGIDFRYRIFNADGSEVEQCGNGARCFVRFVRDQGLTTKKRIRVQTMCGVIEPAERDDGLVDVDMGAPRLLPADVPLLTDGLQARQQAKAELWPLDIGGQIRWFGVASMGNPHAVQIVDDVDGAPVISEGLATQQNERFPSGVNAGFMQIVDRTHIKLRVFERGVGETPACGTGACAAAVLGMQLGLLDSVVQVQAPGGQLGIEWQGGHVIMTGAAQKVFDGELDLPMNTNNNS